MPLLLLGAAFSRGPIISRREEALSTATRLRPFRYRRRLSAAALTRCFDLRCWRS